MYVEHIASVQWKSAIVLTAGFSIDFLIGDFQLSFCTENTWQRKFLGHFRKNVSF